MTANAIAHEIWGQQTRSWLQSYIMSNMLLVQSITFYFHVDWIIINRKYASGWGVKSGNPIGTRQRWIQDFYLEITVTLMKYFRIIYEVTVVNVIKIHNLQWYILYSPEKAEQTIYCDLRLLNSHVTSLEWNTLHYIRPSIWNIYSNQIFPPAWKWLAKYNSY